MPEKEGLGDCSRDSLKLWQVPVIPMVGAPDGWKVLEIAKRLGPMKHSKPFSPDEMVAAVDKPLKAAQEAFHSGDEPDTRRQGGAGWGSPLKKRTGIRLAISFDPLARFCPAISG